jgi:hypothetical protein
LRKSVRQRDRGAGQLLGFGELSPGRQDPGQESLSDHLSQEVLTRPGVPAHGDEALGLVVASLGRDRLGQEGRGRREVVVLAHLFETPVVAA